MISFALGAAAALPELAPRWLWRRTRRIVALLARWAPDDDGWIEGFDWIADRVRP